MTTGRQDAGFALIAALVALVAFSGIAFSTLARDRGRLADVAGTIEAARLAAAADAGLALAVNGLSSDDRTSRWPIDGRQQTIGFDGMRLLIAVEDERGKVPINAIDEERARKLFTADGLSPGLAADLSHALAARRGDGQLGPFRTVEEISVLPGLGAAGYARMARMITVDPGGRGGFDPHTATPFAIAVMRDSDTPDAIERDRELAGQRTALDIADDVSLIGRPLTVRVRVLDGSAGTLERATVIEFTSLGNWYVRYRA